MTMRPIVVRDPSLEGDLASYRRYLPDSEFFGDRRPLGPKFEENIRRLERGEFPELERNPVVPEPPRGAR